MPTTPQAPKTSLTPVVLNLEITNGKGVKILDTVSADSPIGLNGIRWTLAANAIAEATVSLTYKNLDGLNLLKQIFPTTQGNPTFYSTAKVTMQGFSTPFSTQINDLILFKGYIVGYGQENKVGQTTFSLNLRGPMSRIQQIPMACPGYHIANGVSIGVSPFTMTDSSVNKTPEGMITETVSTLSYKAMTSKNGYELFKTIIEGYESVFAKAFSASQNPKNVSQGMLLAIKAFGFADSSNPNPSIIEKELENVELLGDVDLKYDVAGLLLETLTKQVMVSFFNSPQLSFWDFFIYCLQLFSNNVITIGDKYYIYINNPLDDPSEFTTINTVKQEDMLSYDVSDFPYYTPTRCYLAGTCKCATESTGGKDIIGTYPSDYNLTDLEKEIGVYLLYQEAPQLMREYPINKKEFDSIVSYDATKSGKDKSKEQVAKKDEDQTVTITGNKTMFDSYAKYFFILEKLKQRTANVMTRFMPTIIPGLPISIEDPLGIAPFDGHVFSVNNQIDCTSNTALTQIVINHVRYKGELDEYPMKNPLYTDVKLSDIEPIILKQLNISQESSQ